MASIATTRHFHKVNYDVKAFVKFAADNSNCCFGTITILPFAFNRERFFIGARSGLGRSKGLCSQGSSGQNSGYYFCPLSN